jgi:hypothetical protein
MTYEEVLAHYTRLQRDVDERQRENARRPQAEGEAMTDEELAEIKAEVQRGEMFRSFLGGKGAFNGPCVVAPLPAWEKLIAEVPQENREALNSD